MISNVLRTQTHVLSRFNVSVLFDLTANTQIYYLIYAKFTYQSSTMYDGMIYFYY